MKKTKLYLKKSLSVFMAVMMLMTAWVFVAPEKAEAAADKASVTSYSSYHIEVKATDTGSGHIIIQYHPVNADGSINTSVTDEYVLVNSFNAYSNATYVFKTNDDSTRQLSSDTSAETGPVNGWPCGIRWKGAKLHYIKIGGVTVISEGTWSASSERNLVYNDSAWDTYNANWKVPYLANVRTAPSTQTISVPKGGSASKTFTVAYNDQYGVQWPSTNGTTATLSSGFSSASVSVSGNTATVTATEAVFANSGYNSSNGQVKTVLSMTNSGVTASCDVVFQSPQYNVYLQNYAGTTVKTYSNIGYYNQSVTLSDLPANTEPTQIAGNDSYHDTYMWPQSSVTLTIGDVTIKETKVSPSSSHSFGDPVKTDDTYHSITCTVCGYVKDIKHQWDSGVVTTNPTCEGTGIKTYTCAGCGDTLEETVYATGHSFTSGIYAEKEAGENGTHYQKCKNCEKYGWGVTADACETHKWVEESRVNAKCEEDGSITYKCTVCASTSYVKTLTQTGHQNVRAVAAKNVSSVCGEIGWPAFWICDDCGKAWLDAEKTQAVADSADNGGAAGVPDSIEISNTHSFDGAYTSASTGENGEHYRACSICNKAYGLDGVEGATEAHDWNDGTVTTTATCTKEGVKTYKCNLCPQTYTEAIAKEPHAMTEIPATSAECGKAGNNKYYSCSTCNKFYKDEAGTTETTVADETIKALVHTWTAHHDYDTLKTAATCQAAAVYNNHCDYCQAQLIGSTHTYGSPDTANGHKFDGAIKDNGDKTHSYKCTVAGCDEYGAATSCDFTKVKEDVASTCCSIGYTIYECTTCKATKTVDKTAHDFNNHAGGTEVKNVREAKCNTDGYTGDTYCLGCKGKIAGGEAIPADKTKHPHENMVDYEGKASTCQIEGYTAYRYCDQCWTYEIAKETIGVKAHKFTTYTTNNDGTHTATCDTCKAEDGEIAKDTQNCSGGTANCVDKKVCTVCSTAYGEVDANTHKTVVTIAKVPATCQTEGTEAYRYCEACDKALEEIVKIEKLAHTYSAWSKIDGEDKHTRYCTTCVDTDELDIDVKTEDCTGGMAYCNALAKCSVCKAEYGTTVADNHATEAWHIDEATVKTATCQAPGYTGDKLYDCCNALKENGEATQQLAHTFDIEVEDSRIDATCIAAGEVTMKCSTCVETDDVKAATEKKVLAIDAKNHDSDETVTVGAKAATCETDGNTGDIYHKCCYVEGADSATNRKALVSKGTVIKANGQHVYGDKIPEYMIKEIKENKDEDGNVISREIVLKDAEPAYAEKAAARRDDDKWYHAQQCTICGEIVYEACYTYAHTYNCVETDKCEICSGLCSLIDADKHKADLVEVTEGAKAATCVEDGVKSYYKCADCKKTYFDEAGKKPFNPENEEHKAALVIDKSTVSHTIDWDNPNEDVEGDCGNSGYKVYKCSVDGCEYETTVSTGVASNKHTWKAEYDIVKEATCGTNGYKAIKCEVCGATKSNSTVIIPATEEHNYDKNKDGTVDRNDAVITEGIDCQTPGTLTYTCQVCGATKVETDTEGVYAHTWGEWEAKGGDCSSGILQERVCSTCSAKEQKTITTDTHEFKLYIEVLPTAQKDGYRIEKCANCGLEKRTELPYGGSGEGGEGGEGGETPDTPEDDGHIVDENIYTVHEKADCRHGEIRRYTCILCGEMVEREVGEPTDHVWMTQAAEIATCSRPGHSEYKRCLICLKEDGRVNYEQLKHNDGDGDGKCDSCNSAFYDDGEGSKTCGCICHKEGFLMKFLYKILSFFWKLFKIGHSCDCGAVHY